MHITLNVLADHKFLFNVDTCDEGHNIEKIECLSGGLNILS